MGERVQVLMSTYNGEKYLRDQLDSILWQDYPNVSLLVRDDGSTDGTVGILTEYANNNPNIIFYQGENIGVVASFFELMGKADVSAAYFALSDQDDVWMEHKISRAVNVLKKMEENRVALYCGRELLVNEELDAIPMKIRKTRIRPGFGNALVENIATGATCVMNKKLLEMVRNHIPEYTIMHDWWLYLTASCFGKVYFDEKPYLMYRQHENNVMGSRHNYWDEIRIRTKRLKKDRGKFNKQADAFVKSFHNRIPKEKRSLVRTLIIYKQNVRARVKGICSCGIYRQRRGDHVALKVFFLINHL